ncbi:MULTISPECIES: helix-turn-helix transcriptional regulator [unclassified Sphingomonas]|uniref:helix-turn-helix domain-containing protein n=1 Tax=unclassified Sphingomonas TaxID=196159 RepID=UPI000BC53E69|nr:MAG: transcriptional regulator [Sphingomonas sp. 12-62-6]OYX38330.1 MAG: transcriptional regulator [Sphingomonas sp. 32-62-10]
MTAQIVEIGGQKIAMLPADDYARLVAIAEDRDDIAAADAADKRRAEGEEYVPFSLINSIIQGENALRAWRNHRGMTLESLAEQTGSRKSALSDLENGKANGKPALWRKLAEALNVTVDEIMPE